MKEPTFFKEVVYPVGILLKESANAFTEWTTLCAPGEGLAPSSPASAPSTGAMQINVPENGEQEFVVFQNLPVDARAASRIQVRLERNARLRLVVIQDGAEASHIEIDAVCAGEGSEFELRGLQNTKNKQKHSIHVLVKHEKSQTKSDMKVWCVGRDQGHSIF